MAATTNRRHQSPSHDPVAEIRTLEQKLKQDQDSPFGVRLAGLLLRAGRTEEARRLCERAVLTYPDYPTAHLILGKCYLASNQFAEASSSFKRVLSILPDCLPAQQFLRDLNRSGREELGVLPSGGRAISGERDLPTDTNLPEGGEFSGETASRSEEGLEEIEMLAEKLLNVKRPAPDLNAREGEDLNVEERSQDAEIVSETMAEIYASQGAVDEAIRIYRMLIEKRPEEEKKFSERIRVLQGKGL